MDVLLGYLERIFSALADISTAGASSIAIYIFLFKKNAVKSVFNALLNYSYQITFSELEKKLDDLNAFTADDPDQKKKILHILNDIMGQIEGNKYLSVMCNNLVAKIEIFNKSPNALSEARKRSLVSEIRETLRDLKIQNLDDLVGGIK